MCLVLLIACCYGCCVVGVCFGLVFVQECLGGFRLVFGGGFVFGYVLLALL